MGSLANLYISQSYTSLIHLGNDTTASAALVELQDGLGNGLNISVNTQGHISASNVFASGLDVTGTSDFTGKVNIDSHFTASTIPYYNSYDPFYSNAVRVTGSYNSQYGYPPTLEDVRVGWLVNGIGITNARVTSITVVSPTDRYFFLDQCCPAASQYYTFTGQTLAAVNITGSLIVSDNLVVSGTFDIEGGVRINDDVQITGSVDISNSLTASAAFIETDLIVSGTLFAKEVHTLIESSSIIFSTGSNILGDSIADIQTLNGKVIVSGSEEITGSLQVKNDISSSTISGIGNVTLYSQSVDYRLDNLETYSGSAEQKFLAIQASTSSLNNFTSSQETKNNTLELYTASVDDKFIEVQASTSSLNFFTASQETKNSTLASYTGSINDKFAAVQITTSSLNAFTQSANTRLTNLEAWSTSLQIDFATQVELTQTASFLQNQINQKLDTSSFNAYTSTNDTKWTTLASYTSSNDTKWNTLRVITGSFATTGSNNFVQSQTITGSLLGNVTTLSIVGGTASMDCSLGNFFTLNLPSSSTTALTATNIKPGQTIQLKVKQLAITGATTGSLTYPTYIKFPQYGNYNPSPFSGAVDILSFASFDTDILYAVNVRNMNY